MTTCSTEVPLGEFPLVTHGDEIHRSWEDERAVRIQFSGSDINSNYTVEGTFDLHDGPSDYVGHTVEPAGYRLHVFKRANSLWIEVTVRR